MRLKEASECYPINGMGGLYVVIEGKREEIYCATAGQLAMEMAHRMGWDKNGKATVGMAVRKGIELYTRAYWFHDKH